MGEGIQIFSQVFCFIGKVWGRKKDGKSPLFPKLTPQFSPKKVQGWGREKNSIYITKVVPPQLL